MKWHLPHLCNRRALVHCPAVSSEVLHHREWPPDATECQTVSPSAKQSEKNVHFWNVRQDQQNFVTVDAIIYSKNRSYLAYCLLTFELMEVENEDAPFSHHHQRSDTVVFIKRRINRFIHLRLEQETEYRKIADYVSNRMVLISSL